MKRSIACALIALAALGAPTGALALSFTDQDGSPTFLTSNPYDFYPSTVTGWLDITTGQGVNFNPATMTLTSAFVKFAFADTYDPTTPWFTGSDSELEYVTVKLDNVTFLSGVEVDGTHQAYDWTSASGALTGSFLASLQTDGKLQYKVTVTSGDTWFKRARVDATGVYKRVPDAGSTVLLLGLGILGLAASRRK